MFGAIWVFLGDTERAHGLVMASVVSRSQEPHLRPPRGHWAGVSVCLLFFSFFMSLHPGRALARSRWSPCAPPLRSGQVPPGNPGALRRQGGPGGSARPPRDPQVAGPGFLGAGAQQVLCRLNRNKPAFRRSGPPGTRGAGDSPPRADPTAGNAGRAPEGLASCPPPPPGS